MLHQANILRKEAHDDIRWDENSKRKQLISLTIKHEINQKMLAKERRLKRCRYNVKQYKNKTNSK